MGAELCGLHGQEEGESQLYKQQDTEICPRLPLLAAAVRPRRRLLLLQTNVISGEGNPAVTDSWMEKLTRTTNEEAVIPQRHYRTNNACGLDCHLQQVIQGGPTGQIVGMGLR